MKKSAKEAAIDTIYWTLRRASPDNEETIELCVALARAGGIEDPEEEVRGQKFRVESAGVTDYCIKHNVKMPVLMPGSDEGLDEWNRIVEAARQERIKKAEAR